MIGSAFSMTAELALFSDVQLVELLTLRPDLATPPPRDLAALAVRASAWPSILACTTNLDQACRQIIEVMCILAQPATTGALAKVLGGGTTAADLEPSIERMVRLAVVFRCDPAVRLHPELATLSYPGNLGPPVRNLLGAQTATGLAEIARRLGVAPGRAKGETLNTLAQALAEPDRVRRIVDLGPKGTVALATRLATDHPVASVGTGTYYLRGDSPLGWLLQAGLVGTTGWDSVVMPAEVGLALRGGRVFPDFSARPPAIGWSPRGAGLATDDAGSCEQALRVVSDVGTILDAWDEAPPKLLKAGGLGVREVRRAAAATGRNETDAARLIELAGVAGLAGWDDEAGLGLPRRAYDDWATLDAATRWGALVEAWLASEVHLDLAGAIGTNDKPIPPLLDRWPEDRARARRHLVLAALAEGERGQVADVATLMARVSWDAPTLWSDGPARPETLVAWVLNEASMLALVAGGGLTTIGRLVVDGDVAGAIAHVSAHGAPVTTQFVIQADLTVVATGQLPSILRAELELMADLVSSGAATVYRLSEATLRRAFDSGRGATEILAFLETHASKGVPQPLSYLVEDIGRRHGGIRVGTATCYVRSDDTALLAEVLVGRRVAKLELRSLAPTVLVSSAPPETIIEALRAAGYLPALEDSTGALVITRAPKLRAPAGHPIVSGPFGGGGAGGLGLAGGSVSSGVRPGGSGLAGGSVSSGVRPGGLGLAGGSVSSGSQDLAGLVRRLRASAPPAKEAGRPARPSPAPPPWSSSKVPPPPPRPSPVAAASPAITYPQSDLLDDLAPRPSKIAKTAVAIDGLLTLACDEQWLVRIEYVSQKGRIQQVNAMVGDLDGSHVTVGVLPDCHTQTLAKGRIRWVRVLTDAEEELL